MAHTGEGTKLQDQSVTRTPFPSTLSSKQPLGEHAAALHPPVVTAANEAAGKNEQSRRSGTVEISASIPSLPTAVPNAAPSILANIPVAVPRLAPEKSRSVSAVSPAVLIHQVEPRYPAQARYARIQGMVVLLGVIGKDGTLQNLHAASGSPLLIQAALDAVKQWRYKPCHQDGEPVEAETKITLNFSLSGS
jgi:TonB family protein